MRNWMSYGIALVIIIIVGLWMATGTLVTGGKGPGNGETSIVGLIEGENGAISDSLESIGLNAPEGEGHGEGEIDPELSIAERNASHGGGEDGELRSVRVETFTARPYPIEVAVRGRTEAKDMISASAETSGIVDTVHVSKGDTVAPGDLLCTLDRGTREASVAQAEAGLLQAKSSFDRARADVDTNAALRERGLAAANTARPLEVALSAAESSVKAAEAALDQAKAELERTEIHSRISGVVSDPVTSVGALLNPGGVCATIVQLDPIVFVGSVPEARIGLARMGLPVHIETVSGDEMEGTVTYIAATADDATRSFRVEAEVPNGDQKVRDGLTAEAKVNVGTIPAHLLPQSVLTLGSDGELGIRAVDDGVVIFYPITIVSDTREGVWVTGLPARLSIITLGQENVQAGQSVDARSVDEGEASS